jgi:hypothetical protein
MEPQDAHFDAHFHSSGLSLEQLHIMKLPKVPPHLSQRLRINWAGKNGLPAMSAVDASVDGSGHPLVVMSLLMKKSRRTHEFRYVHEEEIPHHDVCKEIQNYIEIAEEEIREEKWIGL